MGDIAAGEDDGALEKKARDMIEYLDDQITRGKQLGVEFTEVDGLLEGAKIMLESGVFSDAIDLINQCTEMASQRFIEFEILQTNIKKAEMKLEQVRNSGEDIEEVEKHLKMGENDSYRGQNRKVESITEGSG